jgi:hypothetical protein
MAQISRFYMNYLPYLIDLQLKKIKYKRELSLVKFTFTLSGKLNDGTVRLVHSPS